MGSKRSYHQAIGHSPEQDSAKRHEKCHQNVLQAPEIWDPELARITFVHKSRLKAKITSQDRQNHDYEILEWHGDAQLQLAATQLLLAWCPNSSVGELSSLRVMMVRNTTLAGIARLHGFDKKIKTAPDIASDHKAFTKILADVLEAYVGAIVESRPKDGQQVVRDWLAPFWKEMVDEERAKASNIAADAKHELAKSLLGKGVKLAYSDIRPPVRTKPGEESYSIGVYLTGWGWKQALIGSAEGKSKDEAGRKAANEALSNEITHKAAKAKQQYDKSVKEEREREGGPRPEVLQALEAEFK